MAEKNKSTKETEPSKKTDITITKKKPSAIKKAEAQTPILMPNIQTDVWKAFDDTFARFRTDFEDLLFPTKLASMFSFIPETRVPVVDLEDREKDFLLKAEMPGFKSEDIEIEVLDDSIAITGTAGWTYDKKGRLYICKERACKTFFRRIELPAEIKVDEVNASLKEGVLEITLPKKIPKQKRKVAIK